MIRTRRSFLQRVKQRSELEKASIQQTKNGDLNWTRSNDDIAVFSDSGDSGLEGSTDELIVCPPVTARNPAQEAAEALRQDLEDMGYELDCKSFITKGTTESDSLCDDRYQRPPRKLKPKAHSYAASSGSAPSSVRPVKDFILSMRSLTSPSPEGSSSDKNIDERSQSTSEDKGSTQSRPEPSDWNSLRGDNSDVDHTPNSTDGCNEDAEKSQSTGEAKDSTGRRSDVFDWNSSCADSDVARLGGRNHADDAPSERASEPSVQTYGSLKKIVTVQAVASFNETTISSLRKRVTEKKSATVKAMTSASAHNSVEAEKEKAELSKVPTSVPISVNTPPIPETLSVPARKHAVKKTEMPKTPVMIEGMSFVKNTTLAPESARNSTLSPRTRRARIKIRRLIQDKLEQKQEIDITSAKTAPAKTIGGFFSDVEIRKGDKPDELLRQETETIKKDSVGTNAQEQNDDEISVPTEEDQKSESVAMPNKEDRAAEILNDTNFGTSLVLEAKKEATSAHKSSSNVGVCEENPDTRPTEPVAERVLVSSDVEMTPPKEPQTAEPSRKFRPLSLLRNASLIPQKKRKPVTTEPEEHPVVEAPREPQCEMTGESKTKEECAYVEYDIETDDGVEVVAIAKTLPFIATDSPTGIQKMSSHNQSHQSISTGLAVAEDYTSRKDSNVHQNNEIRCDAKNGENPTMWNTLSSVLLKKLTSSTKVHETTAKATDAKGIQNETAVDKDCSKVLSADANATSMIAEDEPAEPASEEPSASVKKTPISENKIGEKELQSPRLFSMLSQGTTLPQKVSSEKSNHKEKQPKWKGFRIGLKLRRKDAGFREKVNDQPRDRHEMIQDFLDSELQGQEEHSFPSKLDPAKNPHGASLLQDMMSSQIPKQLIISKLDDSSCITTETEKNNTSGREHFLSPSALDANVWDEIANAGVLVEKAIVQLEESSKTGDSSSKAGSTISHEIEKAVLTLKKHADRLGVSETDLLLAVKDTNNPEGLPKTGESAGSTITSVSTTHTIGQDIFQAFQSFFTNS